MKVETDKEKLDINLQGDILLSKYGIDIDNNKNEEEKITFLKNTVLFKNPIKRWYLRNIKYNLTSTLLLIKWYWKH